MLCLRKMLGYNPYYFYIVWKYFTIILKIDNKLYVKCYTFCCSTRRKRWSIRLQYNSNSKTKVASVSRTKCVRLFFSFGICINTALEKNHNNETNKWIKFNQNDILQDYIVQLSHRKHLTDPLETKGSLTVKP